MSPVSPRGHTEAKAPGGQCPKHSPKSPSQAKKYPPQAVGPSAESAGSRREDCRPSLNMGSSGHHAPLLPSSEALAQPVIPQ